MSYINGETPKSKLRSAIVAALLAAVIFWAAKAYISGLEPISAERESYRLGTVVRLTVWGEDKTALDHALDDSMAEITRLESLFSVNIADSDISKINANSGQFVEVSPETKEVLALAVKNAAMTHGAFDPTIGPVVKLWGIGTKNARVPSDSEINAARALVDYRKVSIHDKGGRTYVAVGKGQSLDLGGIAKGWIADRIAALLKERGVKSAIVDLGGNIYALGESPRGREWKLGLRHPQKPRGEYFAAVDVADTSVVTSGAYERYFEKDGVRYHHILDPSTGRPAQSDLISVSVISKKSADADALCTALFVMGLDRSAAFLKRHLDIQAALVKGGNNAVFITPDLKGCFKLTDGTMALEVLK